MQAEEDSLRRQRTASRDSHRKPTAIPEYLDTGKSRRRVQWSASEDRTFRGDHDNDHEQEHEHEHELDEMGKNSSAFSTLRHSLLRHRETQTRDSDPSPAKELDVYIDSNETDGLPSTKAKEEPIRSTNQNASLSDGWKTVLGVATFTAQNRPKRKDDEILERSETATLEKRPRLEEDDLSFGHGSGILSALLGVDHQRRKKSPGYLSYSSSDSGTSTPVTKSDRVKGKRRMRRSRFSRELGLKGVFDKIGHDDVASKTRSDAGVFGPLMATVGNIAAAAAPRNIQIAPDPTRPGYRLSRYSHAEDEPQSPRSETNSRPASRPPSRPLSRTASIVVQHEASSPVDEKKELPGLELPYKGGGSGYATPRSRGWPSALKALTSVGSHDSPVSTDTESTREKKRRHKKTKRKREEIFITMHVAHIIHRQEFILKLARAFLMFGGPSHRIEAQIRETAKILGLNLSTMYLPNIILISFNDVATGTSNIKFVKQGSALNIGKLIDAYALYWSVIHDEIGVSDASSDLDLLMLRRPLYKGWTTVFIGGCCSSFICPIAFNGSFIDALMVFPLGALLVFLQNLSAKNELYSNVFELVIATLLSFIAGGLASTGVFCYSALAASSIVLILPGYIILCGSLEITSRNIAAGAVRMCYAVMYSLFLGFGLAMGAEVYRQITKTTVVGNSDFSCTMSHSRYSGWWQQTASAWWAFLCAPMYSIFLGLRNQAPWWRQELYVSTLIACAGWAANYFASEKFANRSDVTSAMGGFVVGVAGNLYGRFYQGNAFVVMVTAIMFQLPSGLSNGGLLAIASRAPEGSQETYSSGFQVAQQLIAVAIGLTVGLFLAAIAVHPFASKRRGTAIFSM